LKQHGWEPHTIRVWNPETIVGEIRVGNEMSAAPSIWFEPIDKTVEGGNWHVLF
jgi:hypothetical protein